MNGIRQLLDHAWQLRNDQRIEECRALALQAADALGLPLDEVGKQLPEPVDEIAELTLLFASLARAERRWSAAREWVSRVESSLRSLGKPLPFQLHFQKGLHAHTDGEHSAALECFLAARIATDDTSLQCLALANALIALENLGLPLEKTRAEIRRLLPRLPRSASLEGLRAQLEAFELRHAFRLGKIACVLEAYHLETDSVDQAAYYRLWVSELPFHRFHRAAETGRERFALSHPCFFQKPYRLRTLQGVLHPDDLVPLKATELSDRIYLWTWRWLVHPERFPVERVLALFAELDFIKLAPQLTAEDGQLIRNALSWLGLFDPAGAQPIRRVLECLLQPSVEDFAWYALEFRAIAFLQAWRDGDKRGRKESWQLLARHPLWSSPDLLLPKVLRRLVGENADAGALAAFGAQLAALACRIQAPGGRALAIAMPDYRLETIKGSLVSQPLCLAFELLFQKKTVPCEEILRVCFGLPRFDPAVHGAKIFNLLARMRQISPPGLRFQVRAERVHSLGSWDEVEFLRRATHAATLQERPEWQAFTRRGRQTRTSPEGRDHWVRPALALKKLAGQRLLKREDLEAATGKSKSTVNRLIAIWLRKGILRKTGNARNTRYLLVQKELK